MRWTGTGEHVAELNGIPPTGKKIDVSAISIHRMSAGKIAETWEVWDTLGFLQQLGVVPRDGLKPPITAGSPASTRIAIPETITFHSWVPGLTARLRRLPAVKTRRAARARRRRHRPGGRLSRHAATVSR